ncbi:glycosyltransferase family 87 protein [Chloroflexota bacterium]
MKRINFKRVFLIATIVSLILSYSILWFRMITSHSQFTGTDFVPFFIAAQISRNEGPSQIYDLQLQQKYEESLVGFDIQLEDVRIYLNPPYVVPLVNLIVVSDFVTSLVLWEVMMVLLIFLAAGFLFLLIRSNFSGQSVLIFLVGIVLFFPGYKSLVIGQNSAMLLLGASLWVFGLLTEKDWVAGLGLAFMLVRPHIALPLAIPFLFKRRCIWWWFLAGSTLLAVFSLIFVGMDGILGFIKIIFISASAANTTTGEANMLNLIGVLIRMFPGVPVIIFRWLGWGVFLTSTIVLCVIWFKSAEIQLKQVGLAVLIITFTTPHIHMHDLILWVIPLITIFLNSLQHKEFTFWTATLPLWISFALLICFFSPVLEAIIPYIIYIVLFILILKPEKGLTITRSQAGGA